MKNHITLTLFAGILFSTSIMAAPETYVIDNGHTNPTFGYSHLGFSRQSSRFDKTSGKITIDPAASTGTADITIETKSLNTGNPIFNDHLAKEKFFNIEKYPTITFKSKNFKFNGDAVKSIDGDLTIKGITKPTTLTLTHFHCGIHPMAKKKACGANATTVIKRSEFNMAEAVPFVSDEVDLNIAVEAVKE